ncbi:hypothetical protein Aduo_019481 [Ancylostoma duodenale]
MNQQRNRVKFVVRVRLASNPIAKCRRPLLPLLLPAQMTRLRMSRIMRPYECTIITESR